MNTQTISAHAAAASDDCETAIAITGHNTSLYDITISAASLHNTSSRTARFLLLLSTAPNIAQLIQTLEELKFMIQMQ
jgi:hypothetical protein